MRHFHRGAFLLGSALLIFLVWRTGVGILWNHLTSLGGYWLVLLALEGLAECAHVQGWRRCLVGDARTLPWLRVAMIRQAGAAYNYLTPTANMGGEIIKATLLRREGGGVSAATGVLVGKLALVMAQLLIMVLGSAAVLVFLPMPVTLKVSWALSTTVLAAGIVLFGLLQRAGRLLAFLERMPWFSRLDRGRGGRWKEGLRKVDAQLMEFHKSNRGDFIVAMAWHLGGFLINVGQASILLHALGVESALKWGAAVWFLGTWFDLIGFLVPLGMGIHEGSRVLIFEALRLSGSMGLVMGLSVRIIRSFWASMGLLCYGLLIKEERSLQTNLLH